MALKSHFTTSSLHGFADHRFMHRLEHGQKYHAEVAVAPGHNDHVPEASLDVAVGDVYDNATIPSTRPRYLATVDKSALAASNWHHAAKR